MTGIEKTKILIEASLTRALIKSFGFNAENKRMETAGGSPIYWMKDFEQLIYDEKITENDIMFFLNEAENGFRY